MHKVVVKGNVVKQDLAIFKQQRKTRTSAPLRRLRRRLRHLRRHHYDNSFDAPSPPPVIFKL